MTHSADRPRFARKDAGCTVAVVAAAVGVSRASVERWERGDYAPDANQLATLAGLLGLEIAYFFVPPDDVPRLHRPRDLRRRPRSA